jgi:dephospho-CoA kinase
VRNGVGGIDRQRQARVFGHPGLRRLEASCTRGARCQTARGRACARREAIVLDIPLLYETRGTGRCVSCSSSRRRPGYSATG